MIAMDEVPDGDREPILKIFNERMVKLRGPSFGATSEIPIDVVESFAEQLANEVASYGNAELAEKQRVLWNAFREKLASIESMTFPTQRAALEAGESVQRMKGAFDSAVGDACDFLAFSISAEPQSLFRHSRAPASPGAHATTP